MTTSKTVPAMLQVTEHIEKSITLNKLIGKRAIHRETGWLCTILRASEIHETGQIFTVHFDHQPKNLKQIIWGMDLVIMGGVQANGSLFSK